jgi:hypothetical protein
MNFVMWELKPSKSKGGSNVLVASKEVLDNYLPSLSEMKLDKIHGGKLSDCMRLLNDVGTEIVALEIAKDKQAKLSTNGVSVSFSGDIQHENFTLASNQHWMSDSETFIVINNLDSKANSVKVNGFPLESGTCMPLMPGDKVKLGSEEYIVHRNSMAHA